MNGARGQANLVALVAALVVLTATVGVGIAVADGAFAGAIRDPPERHTAVALSERLVAPDGPLTVRRNTLNETRVETLTADDLGRSYPVARGHDVRVALDGEAVVERGDPQGPTVSRVVLVAHEQTVTWRPPLDGNAVTLPRRTDRVTLSLDPPSGTNVRTIRANDRVVLRNPSGLDGTFTVRVSRFETVRLAFEATGPLSEGDVTVTYYPERTTKAVLEVTVNG